MSKKENKIKDDYQITFLLEISLVETYRSVSAFN